MSTTRADQIYTKSVAAKRNVAVSFVGILDSGEKLSSVTSVTVDPSGPTISNAVINTAAMTILGQPVAIGEAVQFHVIGGTAGVTYVFTALCVTDSTPAQTVDGEVVLEVT